MPGNWHVNSTYTPTSRSARASRCARFSGGGLDDRFDLFLSSQ
jgi:hypothetical protein